MTKQEEIREGIAEFNYYYPDGKPQIRRKWEFLSDDERKPYLDVASLQVFKLHSQGVVAKVDRELPELKRRFRGDYNTGYAHCRQAALEAGYVAVEPLIGDK